MAELIYAGDAGLFKVCVECDSPLNVGDFHSSKQGVGGVASYCKSCACLRSRRWREQNLDRERETKARRRASNIEAARARNRNWSLLNPEKKRASDKRWRENNKSKVDSYRVKWLTNNPEKRRESARSYQRTALEYPKYRIDNAMSCGIRNSLQRGEKSGRGTYDVLGYSREELLDHLSRQFTKGMTFENFGAWHIDHIVPKSTFQYDSVDSDEFRACWSLTNLRPLWAKDNLEKADKVFYLL